MRLAAIASLALVLLATPAAASARGVALLLSGQGGSYAEVTEAIESELRQPPHEPITVAVAGSEAAGSLMQAGTHQLLVTVGTRAAQMALRQADARVALLCVLIPRASFDALLAEVRASEARTGASARRVSAVFLDQPPLRQMELVRQALPAARSVGVVLGPDSNRDRQQLQAAAESKRLTLEVETVSRDTELFPALQRVMGSADVYLAFPDAQVVNADTAQNLLLTSFRLRRPVIGFSSAYVRAGALAAVFSTPTQIGAQAGRVARAVVRGAPMPPPQFPAQFSVAVNRQVARSLDIQVDAESAIGERIARQERE